MILSVSRRTDIPGCYPEWFMNRLRDKYVMTRNPMNFHQVSQINLSPDFIECIVFWTKNAVPFMDYLEELNRMGYMYMFQYTITPYDNTLEKNISDKSDIIKNVLELSEKIEKKRIVWRYDPILLNDTYTVNRHIELFEEMCSLLYTAVNHVVISFIDLYQKNRGYTIYFFLNNINTDINQMTSIADSSVFFVITQAFSMTGGIIGLFIIDFRMTVLVLLFIPIKCVVMKYFAKKQKQIMDEFIKRNQEYAKWFGDTVGGVREVKLFNILDKKHEEFVLNQNNIIEKG